MNTTSEENQGGHPPSPGPHRLRAFVGPGALGNPCLVTVLQSAPSSPPGEAAITQCVTWPRDVSSAVVRCWAGSGLEIQCCGHGLLSCAQLWRSAWPSGGVLQMGSSDIPVQYEDDRVWLGFARLACEGCAVPRWTRARFGSTPIAAATAGDAHGYIVLQWPEGSSLEKLTAPRHDLSDDTGRAVIATCRDLAAGSNSVRLRYFAPQYDVPEDTATGSAMRVLASYWLRQGMDTTLCARQDSPDGGKLFSRFDGGLTWVGGRAG